MADVRKSEDLDCEALAPHLRDADLVELNAHGIDPLSSLTGGHEHSKPCYTIVHEGKPIGMFGVRPMPETPNVGLVWLLGSDEIADIRIQFLRESRMWLKTIGEDYDLLCNCVHEANTLHHRWLKFLGFRFLNHISPFYEFARLTTHV
jgi:hypothetical protein